MIASYACKYDETFCGSLSTQQSHNAPPSVHVRDEAFCQLPQSSGDFGDVGDVPTRAVVSADGSRQTISHEKTSEHTWPKKW